MQHWNKLRTITSFYGNRDVELTPETVLRTVDNEMTETLKVKLD